MHIHVYSPDGEAKFWMEPVLELAKNYGLSKKDLKATQALIEEHSDEIRAAWRKHFPD
jgi:hypothetical protein